MSLFTSVNSQLTAYDTRREQVIKNSREILKAAKKSIFLVHEGKLDEANTLLKKQQATLVKLEKQFRKSLTKGAAPFDPYGEGSWNAAVEEYLEAHFLLQVLNKKKLSVPTGLKPSAHVVVGALSDTTGELIRQAIIDGAKKDKQIIQRLRNEIAAIVKALVGMHLTGQSRQKFDQAKRNLKRAEEILYDIAIRSK